MKTKLLWLVFIIFLLIDIGIAIYIFLPGNEQPALNTNKVSPQVVKTTGNNRQQKLYSTKTSPPTIMINMIRMVPLINSPTPANYYQVILNVTLDTNGTVINSIAFTVVYDKQTMLNFTLLEQSKNLFSKQHTNTKSNDAQGTITYSIINDSPKQSMSFDTDVNIARLQFQNSVLPFSESIKLKNITYTDSNNKSISIPDYTSPVILIK